MIAVSEIEERAKRRSNVMLCNLNESGEMAEEIKRDDEAKLKEIARIMDTKFEALKAIRIGKKETGKTHSLKVIFQSREEWNAVLAKARKTPYQQSGNGKKLGDQNGSDAKTTTGGETTPFREKQTVGRGSISNAHMDNQKQQNTDNQEKKIRTKQPLK